MIITIVWLLDYDMVKHNQWLDHEDRIWLQRNRLNQLLYGPPSHTTIYNNTYIIRLPLSLYTFIILSYIHVAAVHTWYQRRVWLMIDIVTVQLIEWMIASIDKLVWKPTKAACGSNAATASRCYRNGKWRSARRRWHRISSYWRTAHVSTSTR